MVLEGEATGGTENLRQKASESESERFHRKRRTQSKTKVLSSIDALDIVAAVELIVVGSSRKRATNKLEYK